MLFKKNKETRKSIFEKLTGAVSLKDSKEELEEAEDMIQEIEEDSTEGQLAVDVFQTSKDIIVKTMVAGVKPEDLDINITRDMITIKGQRSESENVIEDDYFHRELYWGSFSRTVMLPEEIDVDKTEAIEKNGLLILKLPKIDKHRQSKVRVKSEGK